MRRVLTYRSGVTLVGAESSPAPRHSGLHKLETSIDNRTLVPTLKGLKHDVAGLRWVVADADGFVIVRIEWPAKALVSFDAMVCD